jgi:hypothetical protein
MRRSIIRPRPLPGARAASRIALAVWIACCTAAQPAHAEVHISGTASDLKVEARSATLEEVLQRLGSSFKFQYRVAGPLDGVISGTYSGSLPRVVTRILEGHDFVIHGSPNDMEVVIFGPPGSAAPQRVGSAVPGTPAPGSAGPEPLKECKAMIDGRMVAVEC